MNRVDEPTIDRKVLIVVNVGWFFISHRLPIAEAAKHAGYEVHIATALDPVLDHDTRKKVQNAGLFFHELRLSRSGTHPFELLRDCADLWKLFRQIEPDIVHLVSLKPVLLGGLVARLTNMPAVVLAIPGRGSVFSAAGLIASMRRCIAVMMYRLAYRRGRTMVIIQNFEDRDYFVRRSIFHADDTKLIRGSGADTTSFHATPEPAGQILVIVASRMLHEKGISDFVAAASILKARNVGARFALVGEPDHGNPHSHTHEELRTWADAGVIEWWGFRSDMVEVFAQSHIVCLPTYYGEGVPKVLIEAAAAGRPIVTTNIPGCRDIVKDGESGFLVQPRAPEQLADALEKLIIDPGLRKSMGCSGRILVESQFSLDLVVRQTLDVYREAMLEPECRGRSLR